MAWILVQLLSRGDTFALDAADVLPTFMLRDVPDLAR